MRIFLILFSLYVSTIAFQSCRTQYQHLAISGERSISDLDKFRPAFGVGLYKTEVDVTGRHLSGILVIKKMQDSSLRVVFTSEAGPGFFDFSWTAAGDFKVQSILPQLNKKAVIKTLRKDFELVLMNRLVQGKMEIREDSRSVWYIFNRPKGFDAYITDKAALVMMSMERSSKRKIVVKAAVEPGADGIPERVTIDHQQFNFKIQLTKMKRDVEE